MHSSFFLTIQNRRALGTVQKRTRDVKITFQNQTINENDNRTESNRPEKNSWGKDKTWRSKKSVNVNFGAVYESGQAAVPMSSLEKEENNKGKSLMELQQDAGNANVALQQDYMTLMSHTMSQEDYAKACEDGFDPRELDQDTAVTIVDKIKAELVRSGQQIAGYTDDIDMDTLAAAVGSDTLARSIEEQFRSADLPLTQENINELKSAWDMAVSLKEPEEGAVSYLVDNRLEPEILNLYVAENSGAKVQNNNVPQELQEQMDKVIADAGLTVNDENRQKAQWLVSAGLPLTTDTLQQLVELDGISYPVTEDAFAQAAAAAIAEGKSPMYANLGRQDTIYEKADKMLQDWFSDAKWDATAENLAARKQLEEIRLRMTAEVNVKLLQSDFSIDTAPMEQLIEELRKAEAEVAGKYFSGESQAVTKYETYTQAVKVASELPGLPAGVLGPYSLEQNAATETVSDFHKEGAAMQKAYEEAGERYETLMTAPRSDLGDSIRKAFSNVDDILTDMSLEKTSENQRAVRILAYNRMELTPENMEKVIVADRQVSAVVDRLTPKNVLQMIRDGVNPLEKTFDELESYFSQNPQSYEEEAEDYSRFLYQLERKKDVTEEERKAYIGIYRMVHQIEREDGAAVGAVVNTGAELQFSTLLTAARSRRASYMDWKVSEDTGLTQEIHLSENNISEQIRMGMAKEVLTEVSDDGEGRAAYDREGLQQMREAGNTTPEAAELLQRGEVPISASNLLAAQALMEDLAEMFGNLRRYREKYRQEKEVPQTVTGTGEEPALAEVFELWKQLDQQNFAEDYRTMLQDTAEDVETMSLEQAEEHLDVKQLQLVHKQLRLAESLQAMQEYFLPMYLGEQLAGIHLTLQQGVGAAGAVEIRVNAGDMELEAHLQVKADIIDGYLVGNTPEEVTKLEKTSDIFLEWIQTDTSADWKAEKLPIVNSRDMTRMAAGETKNADTIESRIDTEQLYRLAKGFLQAVADSSGK